MQKVLKYICSSSYDFTDAQGKRVVGISCKCYDPESKTIVKVKAKHLVNAEFGDDVTVNVIFAGRYVNYELAE
ncbi:MAG: hypothetical protein K2H01_05740 [Ruminococcus sp.]|nr:hypothetical protein [Ruminococcus sp.]